MKTSFKVLLLLAVGFLIISLKNNTTYTAKIRARIFNHAGQEVWSNQKVEKIPVEIKISNGIPQIFIGLEVPLHEAYLKEVKAEKLRIWLDHGQGWEYYNEYAINDLTGKPLSSQELELSQTLKNRSSEQLQVKIPESQLDRPENPMERQKWRRMQKGGEIDMEKLMKARRIIKQNIQRKKTKGIGYQRDAGIAHWTSNGPNNIGGRIRSIAVHPGDPNIIFIGAAGGGIWRTENGGATWQAMDDFMASLAVTSIVINYNEPSIMYASTGEGQPAIQGLPGAGIFKSIDGGYTWDQLPGTADYFWINRLTIHPTNPSILYAAFSYGTKNSPNSIGNLIRTINGGASWSLPLLSQPPPPLMDIDISEDNPDLITASGNSAFIRSTDGGASFISELGVVGGLPTGGKRIEIAMFPGDESYMYALMFRDSTSSISQDRCRLYASNDKGVTWTLKFSSINGVFPKNGNIGNYTNMVWIDPLEVKNVFFGGVDLWHSTDGGPNAQRISDWTYYHKQTIPDSFSLHGDHHIIVPAIGYGSSNYTVYFGNDGGIQKADDLRTVSMYSGWQNLVNQTLGITQLYSGAVARDGSIFGGGAQDNAFCTGTSPSNWTQPVTGDGAFMAIHPLNPDTIYANTNYNHLWRSSDGGISFNPLFDLESDGASIISPFKMDPDNPSIIYLGAQQLWKFESFGGLNPIKAPIPASSTITAIDAASSGQIIWVGYSNGVINQTQNGGINWSPDLSPPTMPDNFITDISINPNNSQVIVTVAGYHTNHIWKYDLNNETWSEISMTIPIQVNCVTHHPVIDNWIYVGTDLGIFASEDNGTTWSTAPLNGPAGSQFGNEGPIYTEVTDLFWSGFTNSLAPALKLWASTFGRGLWSSNWVLNKIYVDRIAGSDTNSGTWLNPFKTFKKAAENAGSGAIIVFVQGSNHEETGSILLDNRVTFELNNGPVIIQ